MNATLDAIVGAFSGSTLAADIPLAVMMLQAAALGLGAPAGARVHRLCAALLAAAPGVALVLALRAALSGGQDLWILFWLALSYPLHIWDLQRRPLAPAPPR